MVITFFLNERGGGCGSSEKDAFILFFFNFKY